MLGKANIVYLLSCAALQMVPDTGIVQKRLDLPVVDISGETNRHVVVAQGTRKIYQ